MPYNPFSGWRITGTWQDHLSYSEGGTDYPLPYGTPLPAPAAGTLYTRGRIGPSNNQQCGWVGSAGRRQILVLDHAIGACVAVVFQHLSVFGTHGAWHDESWSTGLSGASADGVDRGGDIHLHIHCLDSLGRRLRFEDYFSGTTTSGSSVAIPIEEIEMPFTDADAQTVAKTQIIIPDPRWGQGSLAETVAATRIRSEDILTGVNLLTQMVAAQATGAGLTPEQLQKMIDASLAESRARTVADVNAALQDDFTNVLEKINGGALDQVPGTDLDAIAKAVNDERDRRERARLGQ